MATLIADTACVDPRAELGDEVEVGPYCVVGPGVRVGRGCRLVAHACLLGRVELGERVVVGPFALVGADPKGLDEPGRVVVGAGAILREHVSVERGRGEAATTIGELAGLGPGAVIGASARVGPRGVVGPGVILHHHVTIGEMAFVGGPTRAIHDVPPFLMADGQPTKVRGINAVALKRAGVSRETVEALAEAHRLLYRAKLGADHAEGVLAMRGHLAPEVGRLLAAIRATVAGQHGRALGREGGDR